MPSRSAEGSGVSGQPTIATGPSLAHSAHSTHTDPAVDVLAPDADAAMSVGSSSVEPDRKQLPFPPMRQVMDAEKQAALRALAEQNRSSVGALLDTSSVGSSRKGRPPRSHHSGRSANSNGSVRPFASEVSVGVGGVPVGTTLAMLSSAPTLERDPAHGGPTVQVGVVPSPQREPAATSLPSPSKVKTFASAAAAGKDSAAGAAKDDDGAAGPQVATNKTPDAAASSQRTSPAARVSPGRKGPGARARPGSAASARSAVSDTTSQAAVSPAIAASVTPTGPTPRGAPPSYAEASGALRGQMMSAGLASTDQFPPLPEADGAMLPPSRATSRRDSGLASPAGALSEGATPVVNSPEKPMRGTAGSGAQRGPLAGNGPQVATYPGVPMAPMAMAMPITLPPPPPIPDSPAMAAGTTPIPIAFDQAISDIMHRNLEPSPADIAHRTMLVRYVIDVYRQALVHVIPGLFDLRHCIFGSVQSRTCLPDGDNDVAVFVHIHRDDPLNKPLIGADGKLVTTGAELMARARDHINAMGTDVHVDSLVFAEVRVMKLVVRGMSVDLTADQIGGFTAAAFVAEVDLRIGCRHLFRRSLILLKAWALHDARILGSAGGYLSTYALTVMLIAVFNDLDRRHGAKFIEGLTPLRVLYSFLQYYAEFKFQEQCVTIYGGIPAILDVITAFVEQLSHADAAGDSASDAPTTAAGSAAAPSPLAHSSGSVDALESEASASARSLGNSVGSWTSSAGHVLPPHVAKAKIGPRVVAKSLKDYQGYQQPDGPIGNAAAMTRERLAPPVPGDATPGTSTPPTAASPSSGVPFGSTMSAAALTGTGSAGTLFPVRSMNIMDPLRPHNNLSRGVSLAHLHRLRAAFEHGFATLKAALVESDEDANMFTHSFLPGTIGAIHNGPRPEPSIPDDGACRCTTCQRPTVYCTKLRDLREFVDDVTTPPQGPSQRTTLGYKALAETERLEAAHRNAHGAQQPHVGTPPDALAGRSGVPSVHIEPRRPPSESSMSSGSTAHSMARGRGRGGPTHAAMSMQRGRGAGGPVSPAGPAGRGHEGGPSPTPGPGSHPMGSSGVGHWQRGGSSGGGGGNGNNASGGGGTAPHPMQPRGAFTQAHYGAEMAAWQMMSMHHHHHHMQQHQHQQHQQQQQQQGHGDGGHHGGGPGPGGGRGGRGRGGPHHAMPHHHHHGHHHHHHMQQLMWPFPMRGMHYPGGVALEAGVGFATHVNARDRGDALAVLRSRDDASHARRGSGSSQGPQQPAARPSGGAPGKGARDTASDASTSSPVGPSSTYAAPNPGAGRRPAPKGKKSAPVSLGSSPAALAGSPVAVAATTEGSEAGNAKEAAGRPPAQQPQQPQSQPGQPVPQKRGGRRKSPVAQGHAVDDGAGTGTTEAGSRYVPPHRRSGQVVDT